MADVFDPYHRWLGIAPPEQPPHHYRLLGLEPFEENADVIESAAERQTAYVRTFLSGKHAAEAQRLLGEISTARVVLLSAQKADYDAELRTTIDVGKKKPKQKKKPAVAQPLIDIDTSGSRIGKGSSAVSAGETGEPPVSTIGGLPVSTVVIIAGIAGGLALLLVVGAIGLAVWSWESPPEVAGVTPENNENNNSTVVVPPPPPPSRNNNADQPSTSLPSVPQEGDHRSDDGRGQRPAPSKDSPPPDRTPPPSEGPSNDPPRPVPEPAPEPEPTKAKRDPIPDKAAREAGRKRIAGLFPLDQAQTPEQKGALAKQLVKVARETTDNSAARFVLLNLAREQAADAAQLRLALEAVDLLEVHYEFAAAPVRLASLGQALKASLPPADKREAVVVGLEMMDEFIARDDYETAGSLVEPLADVARRARDRELIDLIVDRRKQASEMQEAFQRVKPSLDTLAQNPDDPAANLAAGKFYLLAKLQPDRAMPLLAKGSDEQLAQVAKLELSSPQSAAEQEALADSWWKMAEAEKDKQARQVCQAQSGYWYREAVGDLDGLSKVKAQQRIKDVEEALGDSGRLAAATTRPRRQPKGPVAAEIVVKDKEPVPLVMKVGMPADFQGATTFAWTASANKNGMLEFTVEKSGIVVMAASFPETKYEGNTSGGWYENRITRLNLVQGGWQELGRCPWDDKMFLYRRIVEKGQTYRIQTNKYGPPQVFLPPGEPAPEAVAANTPPVDLGVFSRDPDDLRRPDVRPPPIQPPEEVKPPPTKDASLVGHWKFDERQGEVAADAAGGHHGTIKGAAWGAGKQGGGLSFDGEDDVAPLGNPAELNFEGVITIAAWVRPRSFPPDTGKMEFGSIVTHGFTWEPPREVVLRVARRPNFGLVIEAGSWTGQESIVRAKADPLTLGEWAHLATVYDGQHWRLYCNGRPIAAAAKSEGAVKVAENWAVGGHPSKNMRHFHGDIDDVRIYNRALSAEEVQALSQAK